MRPIPCSARRPGTTTRICAASSTPGMPVEDRAADTWEPLCAVADLAGGDWPARARNAAVALTADDDTDTSLGARLLADLKDVFGDADALHTETILAALCKISEAPWGDYFGKELRARDMARLLRPYRVASVDVKIDGTNRKGYRRDHLHDAWDRYLPPEHGGSATSATSATAQVSDHDQVAGSASHPLPATSDPPLTCEVAQVAQVAHNPCACPRHQAQWGPRKGCLDCRELARIARKSGAQSRPDSSISEEQNQ